MHRMVTAISTSKNKSTAKTCGLHSAGTSGEIFDRFVENGSKSKSKERVRQ